MSCDIVEKIKKIKNYNGQVNPDRDWVAQNRAQMMTQIKNTLPETKPKFNFDMVWQGIGIFIPNQIVYHIVRPVTIFAMVAIVATGGWIASVSATENCLPGDICYGVKMATEKTQLVVASVISSDEREAQMHMELASKRAREIKQVVSNNKNDSAKNVQIAVANLEQSIHTAEEKMKDVSENNPARVFDVSKSVTEKSKEIKDTLKDLEQKNGVVNVNNVQKLTNEVSLASVEMLVQKKEEGVIQASDDEVKQLVNDQIEIISNDAGVIQQKAEAVSGQLIIADAAQTQVIGTTTENVTATTNTTTVKDMIDSTNKTVAINSEQTERTLIEAKTLVESNQLMEAIQKVKEVSQFTQETAQVITEAQKIVDGVQVQVILESTSTVIVDGINNVIIN